ncbi:MAG TPA: hypothetical protein VGG28_01660 [Kofleriaceae bacterium]|jgi:hypothetical protein
MKRFFLLALLAACAHNADDTSNGPSFPACSDAAQPCLDAKPIGAQAMPFYRNFSLTTANPSITSAVIIVHADERDANAYFADAMAQAQQAGVDGSTIVIAPHFQCDADNPAANELYWACSGHDWSHGFADKLAGISSYAIVDGFVESLADKKLFPNLSRIVITGMGSGGQLVQRYAATNQIDPVAGIAIAYAPISPSSYVWPDSTRPSPQTNCAGFDDYYYGLQNRSGYVAVPTQDTIVHNMSSRDLQIFVGSEDTLANASDGTMDESCGANAQGIDRLSRAQAYVAATATPLTIVPGCDSDRECMLYAPEVRAAVLAPNN